MSVLTPVRVQPLDSVKDAASIYLAGDKLDEPRFIHALGYKAHNRPTSRRSWALRKYELMEIDGGIRRLLPLGIEMSTASSPGALIYMSSRPEQFQVTWEEVHESAETSYLQLYSDKEAEEAIAQASSIVGFLSDEKWNLGAIKTALECGFSRDWANAVALEQSSSRLAAPECAFPRSTQQETSVTDAYLGISVTYRPSLPGVFPKSVIEGRLCSGSRPVSLRVTSGRWSISSPQDIEPENFSLALQFCRDAWRDLEDGSG